MSGYNNDTTLREVIRNFLNTLLNNASNVGGEQLAEFVLGKDLLKTDDDLIKVKQIDGTFRTMSDTFTVGMITDFLGKPEPIKGLKLIRYSIPIVFLVPNDAKYEKYKESLERFTELLIGEDFEESGYIFATNTTEITNTEQVQKINGIDYIKLTVTVFITSTKESILGNKIESYLGETDTTYVRIYPTGRTTSRAFIPEETQWNNQKETFTIFKESTWSANLSFVIDKREDLYASLIWHLEEPTELNKVWYHRTIYPIIETPFDKEIGIESLTFSGEIGEYGVFTIKMKKSGINA